MCGILGWATPRPLADEVMERGLDALAHRGPDGRGVWRTSTRNGGEVALGHTRLSIIDIAGGAQPLPSHDKRFAISFNGEIYNYIELRETLRARGCRFMTDSDTEVLVEAYRVWGMEALTRLRGMFAFALYDTQTEQLVLARDLLRQEAFVPGRAYWRDGVLIGDRALARSAWNNAASRSASCRPVSIEPLRSWTGDLLPRRSQTAAGPLGHLPNRAF